MHRIYKHPSNPKSCNGRLWMVLNSRRKTLFYIRKHWRCAWVSRENISHDTLANDRLVLTGGQWTDKLADELHRPKRKHFPRRQVKSNGIDLIFSADLVDMSHFARHNRGYKYLLTIIDIFSRYAWVMPLKTKTGKEITQAFSSVLKKSKRKPQKLWTDRGGEF